MLLIAADTRTSHVPINVGKVQSCKLLWPAEMKGPIYDVLGHLPCDADHAGCRLKSMVANIYMSTIQEHVDPLAVNLQFSLNKQGGSD